ncbi:hypothetical protein GCM10009555_017340 [Acrocarpospora macrocephala]|uniref:Uncharacterized protein n=1 Tax=Acrocarpospora macrocephala TaxID=150177 RepID=A0A5M3WEK0_9ACTN|nr:hypothetical protein [Acrocarpospora macrocephala]GES07394.1 hypothetical protein Amac_009890 [Acrocarpospora macrocephala]
MSARIKARRASEEAEMLTIVAEMQEKLADAKAAADADPSPENLAARQEAMDEVAEFRSWVRGVARIRKLRDLLADSKLPDEKRERCGEELASLEERLGGFLAELEQLGSSAGQVPLPPGSVEANPQPARSKSRLPQPGGGR